MVLVVSGGLALGALKPARPQAAGGGVAEGNARVAFWAASGGFAELAADAAWVRLNVAWEERRAAEVRAWQRLALEAAPGSEYFRLNVARQLAFDLPAWRRQEQPEAPVAVVVRWRREGAEEAMRLLLADGRPGPAELVEAANIALYALEDRARAADLYRQAAETPGAPWHAGRIHAQLLRELGRDREALDWLRAWAPRLPADDPGAQRELVWRRIADLELELSSRGEPL